MLCIGVNVFFVFVIPASKARRESFRKDSGQAGMTNRYLAALLRGSALNFFAGERPENKKLHSLRPLRLCGELLHY
jgi:hypothetical protein